MLLTAIKLFGLLFPFIKELFFGKTDTRRKTRMGDQTKDRPLLKKAVIAAGVMSFVLMILSVKRVFDLSSEIAQLRKNSITADTNAPIETPPPASGIKMEPRPVVPPAPPVYPEYRPAPAIPGPKAPETPKRKPNVQNGDEPTVEPPQNRDEQEELDRNHRALLRELEAIKNAYR